RNERLRQTRPLHRNRREPWLPRHRRSEVFNSAHASQRQNVRQIRSVMKAVILAAGKGTRMKELTNEVPKPMLKVQGKPILEHIIQGIVSAGIREVFIVTGFRADAIENFFGDGSKWNVRIAYGRQVVQDGTGKAPELAKE